MIPLLVTITDYIKVDNYCKAELQDGREIAIDPFVSCAIELSDEDYSLGLGSEIIGNRYLMIEYSVYKNMIAPHEGGFLLVGNEGSIK